LIDSHAHIEMCEGSSDAVVERALEAGVERILTIGLSHATFDQSLAIADRHPGVFAALGWHPNMSTGFGDREAEQIATAARDHRRVRAIGETGLDFYRDSAPPNDQRRAFRAQIEIAADLRLPLVIHARAAEDEVLDVLDEHAGVVPAVIMHCFSAAHLLDRVLAAGYTCSFAGNVTYKNAGDLRTAAARVPDAQLLVETDAPFLAPQPVRGKQNEPANVTMTAEAVAQERGVSYEELERIVSENARRLFAW
jgi:TatD DNase family protein